MTVSVTSRRQGLSARSSARSARWNRILIAALVLGVAALPVRLAAQIEVEGLEDEEVYDDAVSFHVVAEAGYEYSALLDGSPLETGVIHDVTFAGYHELLVRRTPSGGGAEEEELVQFIVRATARGNAEWGLPPWVPYAPVASAAAEFAGTSLSLMVPERYPQDLPLPLVAWVRDAEGDRVGVNGFVTAPQWGGVSIRILRGVGSAFLPPFGSAGLKT